MAVRAQAEHVTAVHEPPVAQPPAPPRARRRLAHATAAGRLSLVAALVPLAIVAIQGWSLRWTADDAFINFRVVDQLVHGHGPVFNLGERVEAFTSPLWVAILWVGDGLLGLQVEWVAVALGLALSLLGLACACLGAATLARDRGRGREEVLLPLGALVFAVLPGTWEFLTSGLETGLSFAWIGASFLCLARIHASIARGEAPSARRLRLAAFLLGLGPLVRPDFLIFGVGFVAVLCVLARQRRLRLVAAAAALPLLYQLFRMGYFASLVPNTAIAKEASGTDWPLGADYLWDLVGTYWLWLPLAGLLAWSLAQWREDRRGGHRLRALVVAVPVVTGLVHALFVVKVGGDFMHARMLLPALFAVLCPAAVVAVPARRSGIALAVGVATWALVCAATLRVPYDDGRLVAGQVIVDERAYYLRQDRGAPNPVTREDYRRFAWEQGGAAVRARAARGERSVTFAGPNEPGVLAVPDSPARHGLPVHMVAAVQNVGLYGYAAGLDVWVVDRLGLADPIASRIGLAVRGRPGHEKLLPPQWVIARFGAPGTFPGDGFVAAARRALGCSVWRWDGTGLHREAPIPRTLDAVSKPLTLGQFVSNVRQAAIGDKLRFPADPPTAADAFCGPSG